MARMPDFSGDLGPAVRHGARSLLAFAAVSAAAIVLAIACLVMPGA